MEIRCEECGEVGPAELQTNADGVSLVCSSCGHLNSLDIPPQAQTEEDGPQPERPAVSHVAAQQEFLRQEAEQLSNEAYERLIPEPGAGDRCPKCAKLMEQPTDHCGRCGLAIVGLDGKTPWERPPKGREQEYEQATLLWDSLVDDWNEENFEKFACFVREEGFPDLATRRLRFWLIDHPDEPLALGFLREIAEGVHSRVILATAHAQTSAAEFSEVTQRANVVLLWTMFVVIVLVIFMTYAVVRGS